MKNILTILILGLSLAFPTTTLAQAENTDPCNTPTETQKQNKENLIKKYPKVNESDINFNLPKNLLNPEGNWENSNNTQRTQYCQTISFLEEYIKLAKAGEILDCKAKDIKDTPFDSQCTTLLFKKGATSNDENQYYKNSQEANIDKLGNNNGEIDGNLEVCLQTKIQMEKDCNWCKSQIQNDPRNTPTLDKKATNQGTTQSKLDCKDYINTDNCSTALECTDKEQTPILSTNRTPFGTEFFDVNDPQKGLTSQNQLNQNFNPNVQGGPLIGTINTIANFLARMIAVLSLLIFVTGAFILITANGEENQINRGKDAIKLSLVGIVIVMLSYTIVVLIQSIFF